jgi:hypothetical protein
VTPERRTKLGLGCLSCCPDGREDSAARGVELLVRGAGRALGELLDPVTREARVRVAIDESGDRAQPTAVQLDDVAAERAEILHAADTGNATLLAEDVRIFDDLDLPERLAAQGRLPPGGCCELRQVAHEQA